MGKSKYLSIIVPVYNEQENVTLLHASLSSLLNDLEGQSEIIYVNDGSRDETLACLRHLTTLDHRVKVIDLARNFGQTAAMAAGVALSEGTTLVFLDGDLQNDPRDILASWQKFQKATMSSVVGVSIARMPASVASCHPGSPIA